MIVKNEAEVLDDCLTCIKEICDEIIVVDTGSTDETKNIARKYTNNVYHFKWIDNFAAARNYAFSKATKDYILWLDADDILTPNEQDKFKKLKSLLPSNVDAVSMKYILQFEEYGNPEFYFRRHRLVKRINNFQWIGQVHEYLEVGGHIYESDISIVHRKKDKTIDNIDNNRNLKIYESRLKKGDTFTPRDLYYFANELKDHRQYDKALFYYERFLNNKTGWMEDKIRACLNMADIYQHYKDEKSRLKALYQTFTYDIPRPEACCKLGDYFIENNSPHIAVYWYEQAIQVKLNPQGFHYEAYSTWYPHLSLCAAYWKVNNAKQSLKHHEIVKEMRPNDPKVKYNEQFFKNNYKSEVENE